MDAKKAGVRLLVVVVLADLGTLGGATSSASAINDRGQVVGESLTAGGATQAFLWQPN